MGLFPFETKREGQERFIEKAEEAIESGSSLIAHAPTGLGKTAAALTPALESGKTFFLTPRHSQHEVALEAARMMDGITSVDLIGRSHMCEAPQVSTQGPSCPRHDQTFENGGLTDRAKARVSEFRGQNLSAEQVVEKCSKVCPYSVSLEMAKTADLVVADYFHIFHPGIREMILGKADTELSEVTVVVDEAHNLPSRTRGLFSTTISLSLVSDARTEAEKFGYYTLESNLDRLMQEIRALDGEKREIKKSDLNDRIDSYYSYEELIVDLEAAGEEVQEEEEKSYCMKLSESLEAWKRDEEGFFRYVEPGEDIKLKHRCLDPSISTSKPLNQAKASILMSGTLKPLQMYEDLLGVDQPVKESFESPFPDENRLDLVVDKVTTRYKERDESMMQKYAWYLGKSLESLQGNAGIFFPSYELMKEIGSDLRNRTDKQIFIEKQGNSKEEKAETLNAFKKHGDAALLGVASGSYGEGVDYPGEQMKAVFMVGLPLKKPDIETEALIDYLDEKYGKGWQYGYTYPAMNTALQSIGRVIRSKEDRGIICLMDKRYKWNKYSKLLQHRPQETRAPWKEIEQFQEEQK